MAGPQRSACLEGEGWSRELWGRLLPPDAFWLSLRVLGLLAWPSRGWQPLWVLRASCGEEQLLVVLQCPQAVPTRGSWLPPSLEEGSGFCVEGQAAWWLSFLSPAVLNPSVCPWLCVNRTQKPSVGPAGLCTDLAGCGVRHLGIELVHLISP